MSLEVASLKDGILTYDTQGLILWDPGGSVHVLDAAIDVNWNSTRLLFSLLTWDPGGHTQHRLEGKPNFMKGGLPATFLLSTLELGNGPAPLGLGLQEDTKANNYIYLGEGHGQGGLEHNGLDGGFGRGLAGRVCLSSFFLLDPHLLL